MKARHRQSTIPPLLILLLALLLAGCGGSVATTTPTSAVTSALGYPGVAGSAVPADFPTTTPAFEGGMAAAAPTAAAVEATAMPGQPTVVPAAGLASGVPPVSQNDPTR